MKKLFVIVAALCVFFTAYSVELEKITELSVPMFHFEVGAAVKPDSGKKADKKEVTIAQKAAVTVRFRCTDYFYSDLGFSFAIPDTLAFVHPDPAKRKQGTFRSILFSLNAPCLLGNRLSVSLFTGTHGSLNGNKYMEEFFKYRPTSVRLAGTSIGQSFMLESPVEHVGASIGGRFGKIGYFAGSFGWNARPSRDDAEYGMYLQGGFLTHSVVSNNFTALHVAKNGKKLLLSGSFSILFFVNSMFSVYMETGMRKTDMKSKVLQDDVLKGGFVFFEPRFQIREMNFDFTFFLSSMNTAAGTTLLNPYAKVNGPYDPYTGLNFYFDSAVPKARILHVGLHMLTAVNIYKAKAWADKRNDKQAKEAFFRSFVLTISPFLSCDLRIFKINTELQLFPLEYGTPLSMFEGKVSVSRDL